MLIIFDSDTMGILRKLAEYLYIRKRDPNEPTNSWIGYMNTINRISIFMFLIGLLIIIFRMIFQKTVKNSFPLQLLLEIQFEILLIKPAGWYTVF